MVSFEVYVLVSRDSGESGRTNTTNDMTSNTTNDTRTDRATDTPSGTSADQPATGSNHVPATGSGDVPDDGSNDVTTRSAQLDEVWLLDRQDGSYDWGLTVRSTADEDRGPFEIDASIRDPDRNEVVGVSGTIGELAAGAVASVGGTVAIDRGEPRTLAVDVTVGAPLSESALDVDDLRVVGLSRRRAPAPVASVDPAVPAGGGEVIVGRLRSAVADDVVGVRLALLWRDAAGDVVAAIFHDVERVRPGVDARFEIPVGDRVAAEGLPSEVSWSR